MNNDETNQDKAMLIEPLIERIGDYTKTNYQLVKLKTIGKSADVASQLVSRSLVIVACAMFVLILSMGVSFWLGELLQNTGYGFFCVALFYGLLALLLYYIFHKRIKQYLHNRIIVQLLN
ncbi:MAG: hypothetical protein IT236_15380 [Bacteroidia bacterium]|nr:hypothetical protein [Bacteroidia bacterium]